MKARALIVVLLVAASLAVGAWWFSPWWVLNQAKAAAERNDAQALSDVIDYPRLRESLKGEINSALVGRLRDGASGLGEVGRTGATLGAVLASALVDKLVEVMVRPEFFIRAIRDGQFVLPGRSAGERDRGAAPGAGGDAQGSGAARSGSGTQRGGAAPGSGTAQGGTSTPGSAPGGASAPGTAQGGGAPEPARFKWRPERASADRMIVWVSRADPATPASATPASEFGLVFERRGWLDWKLCAVRLPPGLAGGR